ncbi:Thiamine-phosphate synthase [compost metagenome]
MQCKAAGIHVGANDLSPVKIKEQWNECQILGYSLEWLDQLKSQEVLVSDYIALSPVFSTTTKTNTITEWGLKGIEQVRALTDKQIVTIGNMNATNAAEVIRAGADCLSVVSAICSAKDPKAAAAEIRTIIERSL